MAQNQRGAHSSLSSNQTVPSIEDQESLASMLSKQSEIHHHHSSIHLSQTHPFLAGARTESVHWILKINAHHSFSAATAILAVNYFDGLLLNTPLFQQEKRPWTFHLAAVACLSIAAKMEETHFPTLSEFQVEGITRILFEPKTIQRMEILVLSKLQWKMNPVTPVSFLYYIAKRLESNGDGEFHNFSGQFVRRCETLLLSSVSDGRFMGYLPSIMAASVATLVITGMTDQSLVAGDYQDHIFSILGIQEGQLDDCCKMIVEAVSRNYFCAQMELHLQPSSPKGVTDASFSPNGSDVDSAGEEEGKKLRF